MVTLCIFFYLLYVLYLLTGAVIGVRAMLCMSLMSGLIGWAVGMVALIAHKPRFLFTVALAFGIQGSHFISVIKMLVHVHVHMYMYITYC